MTVWRRVTAAALACALLGFLAVVPASAVRTTDWADWDPLTGTANDYVGTLRLPVKGFPNAALTSDSRAGSVGVQSGASVYFTPSTAPGAKYGSSEDRPYLNLRPKADRTDSPSTTTYAFERPTPPTGWTFVLGDVDADSVKVTAKDGNGQPVPAAGLGFVSTFNLCDTPSPRPGGCSGGTGDVPTWDPATQTLTGNAAAADTFGASAYFEPTVPLSTLTLSFTRRSGFPIYQTWFAAVARTISGTVTDGTTGGGCALEDVVVRLVGPSGQELERTSPGAGGAYSFGQYATQPGYVVAIDPPDGCAVTGPRSRTVSTAVNDADADFAVRQIIPQPVSGTVTDDKGNPVPGVEVTLHAPGGGTTVTTTGPDGSYRFDDNAVGTGYVTSIDPPDGYTATGNPRDPFEIDDQPITGEDFIITANPDVSGTVSGDGAGIGGVTVTLTSGGQSLTTVTDSDGTYTFERVPSGRYDISIDTPSGYLPVAPIEDVTVGNADVTRQDFALSRTGTGSGTRPTPGPAPRPGAAALPDTGGISTLPLFLGCALLGLGGAVVILDRSRRTRLRRPS